MPPPTFRCQPDSPVPLCAETPDCWSPVKLIVYGFDRSPEGVAMCNYLLGFLGVDPNKSQNKVRTQLYRRSPPRQSVSRSFGLGVQKLEREREVDVGEAPTQRVMGYLAYTTLMTLEHTWYATPYLLVPPRRSGATLRQIGRAHV